VGNYVAGPPLLNEICTSLLSPPPRLRNDLYCFEWDVKLHYTIPPFRILLELMMTEVVVTTGAIRRAILHQIVTPPTNCSRD